MKKFKFGKSYIHVSEIKPIELSHSTQIQELILSLDYIRDRIILASGIPSKYFHK